MTPIVRTATLEEIHRLYQRIPEFGSLHSPPICSGASAPPPPAC